MNQGRKKRVEAHRPLLSTIEEFELLLGSAEEASAHMLLSTIEEFEQETRSKMDIKHGRYYRP